MWVKTSDAKPKEGQKVLALLHCWSQCTNGHVDSSWIEDRGSHVFLSWYTNNPFPSESGTFIDGFAFNDGDIFGTLHVPPKVEAWMPIPEHDNL